MIRNLKRFRNIFREQDSQMIKKYRNTFQKTGQQKIRREEEPGADHEMDTSLDPEKSEDEPEEEEDPEEEDPEELEEQEEENEIGEGQVEAVEPSDDEYQEYFADYFELAPPASPDSSEDSTPLADN
ncbi:hypothetical protein PIB30_047829 [Stylosanthes scabra]|uniref:Uncharacterized protein n=1 Tax=Stylosanthes scabra TaxID=79078 RepID=A0ABU6ZFL7_9FABA|nr:hypothetical protein [Stylosanthes scabra]